MGGAWGTLSHTWAAPSGCKVHLDRSSTPFATTMPIKKEGTQSTKEAAKRNRLEPGLVNHTSGLSFPSCTHTRAFLAVLILEMRLEVTKLKGWVPRTREELRHGFTLTPRFSSIFALITFPYSPQLDAQLLSFLLLLLLSSSSPSVKLPLD